MAGLSPPGYASVAGGSSGAGRVGGTAPQDLSSSRQQQQRSGGGAGPAPSQWGPSSASFLQQQQRQARAGVSRGASTSGAPLGATGKHELSAADTFLSQLILFLDDLPPAQAWPGAALRLLVINPAVAVGSAVLAIVTSPRTHRIVLRLGVLSALLWTALALAIIAYIGFVRVWLPEPGLRKTVWLQYGEGRAPYAYLDFAPPSATRARNARVLHSEAAADVLDAPTRFFAEDQAYDVTLELQVPLTAANVDLGNFMVALDLRNERNQSVWRASRPAIVLQEPLPVRALSSLSLLLSRNPPHVGALGAGTPDDFGAEEGSGIAGLLPGFLGSGPSSLSWSIPTQMLSIPLLRRKIMHPSRPTLAFLEPDSEKASSAGERAHWASPAAAQVKSGIVSVGRADADRFWGAQSHGSALSSIGMHGVGGAAAADQGGYWAAGVSGGARSRGELQTHSVSLRFDAHLTGIRYLMYHHPILSFLLFTSLFFSFELATGLFLWGLATVYTSPSLHDGLRPRLQVEESWVEGVRRRAPRGREADEGDTEETYTEDLDERRDEEDEELTETEDGGPPARSRWAGVASGTETDESPAEVEGPIATMETYREEPGSLRRRAGGPEPQQQQQRTGRATAADPRAAAAAAAAATFRTRDEEERAEAERARLRRDLLAGRRMTDITDLTEGSPGSSGPSSPLTLRGSGSAGAMLGEGGDGSPSAGMTPTAALTDPFLDVGARRRILSRLDEETEEDTVSASSVGDAASTVDGDDVEQETRAAQQGDDKPQDDDDAQTATVGGSETSRGSSMARSFGGTTAPSVSTAATSEVYGGSQRQQPSRRTAHSGETSPEELLTPTATRSRPRSRGADSGDEADVEPTEESGA